MLEDRTTNFRILLLATLATTVSTQLHIVDFSKFASFKENHFYIFVGCVVPIAMVLLVFSGSTLWPIWRVLPSSIWGWMCLISCKSFSNFSDSAFMRCLSGVQEREWESGDMGVTGYV